ncbi:olfactory receptor 2D2-like [Sarcophilus harrisii]
MLSKRHVMSFTNCAAQLFLYLFFGATQCALLAVMSYDRYLAICDPMHYSVIMTWKVCGHFTLGCWISGVLISLVDTTFTLCLSYQGDNRIDHFFCEAPVLLDLSSGDTHRSQMVIFFVGVVILLAPVSLILVSYSSIIVTVIKMKTTSGRLKAFSTCSSHLTVVVLFYGSAIMTYMTPTSSKEQGKLVSVFYAVVNPMLNPLIYSLRNKDVTVLYPKFCYSSKERKNSMKDTNKTWVTEFFFLGLSDDLQIQILLFILFLVVYLVTVLGNQLLISLVLIDSKLHTSMYFFLGNLSLADLCFSTSDFCFSTTIVPQTLVHMISRRKLISFMGCAVQLLFILLFGCTECALLAVMSYDRYLAICDPMHYPLLMTWKVCIQLALVCWVSGILVSMVDTTFTLQPPYQGENRIPHFFCEPPALLELASADTHNSQMAIFLMGVVILLAPVTLILVSYGCIIVTVVRMKTTSGRLKAFSTCGSHLLVVIIFYGSAIISYMTPRTAKEQGKLVSVFYAVITPMLNPLIYSLKNKDVKKALRNAIIRGPLGKI